MNKKNIIYSVILLIISLLVIFFKKNNQRNDVSISKKFSIVCTTGIIADAVMQLINKEHVSVKSLMGPGIDPHLYRPTAHDMYTIQDADIIIYNGLHLEGKMADILESLSERGKYCYAISDFVNKKDLQESEYQGVYDPHIWFDIIIWRDVLKGLKSIFIKHLPDDIDQVLKKYNDYDLLLIHLHEWVIQKLQCIPTNKRILITAHDAFNYFGKRYNFCVEGLQGISTDAEVTLSDVERVASLIIKHNIPVIFIEQTISKTYLNGVQELLKKHGMNVSIGNQLYSDALGEEGTGAETYINMIRSNIVSICDGLS